MKIFLKKLLNFLAISILIITLIASTPLYIIKRKSSFKLEENITNVVFGHSHPECAYNDSLIAKFKNLAESGECYFYTLQKVKKVIPDNPQIETVFLEFSNNQISSDMDDWIWGYEKMNYYLPKYSPFMKKEDFEILLSNNSTDFIACTSVSFKKNLFRVLKYDFDYSDNIGGFNWLDVNQLKDSDPDNNANLDSISQVNLEYLRKIIEYCQHRDVTVFLTRSPQHKDFYFLKNEKLFQKIRNEKFSDVEFLDFNNFPIPDNYFADFGHLNYKGAEIFSNSISELLNSGLLDSENKEEIINDFIANY